MQYPKINHRTSKEIPLLLLFFFALLAVVVFFGYRQQIQLAETAFNRETERAVTEIQAKTEAIESVLTSLAGVHAFNDNRSDNVVRTFSNELIYAHPSINQILQWTKTTSDELEGFIETMKEDGFPAFKVVRVNNMGDFVLTEDQDQYIPLSLIEPMGPLDVKYLGLDALQDPRLAEVINSSIASGKITSSLPMRLLGKEQTLLTFKPLYHGKYTPREKAERKRKVYGLFAASISGQKLFENIVKENPSLGIKVESIETPVSGGSNNLFTHEVDKSKKGTTNWWPVLTDTKQFTHFGPKFNIHFSKSSSNYAKFSKTAILLWALVPILAVSLLNFFRNLSNKTFQEKQYLGLINDSVLGIIIHDEKEVFYANDALLKMLGFETKDELIESEIIQIILSNGNKEDNNPQNQGPSNFLNQSKLRLKTVDGLTRFEIEYTHPNGETIFFNCSEKNTVLRGREIYQTTLSNITDTKMATVALCEAMNKAEQLALTKGESLATLGREIRSSVSSVVHAVDTLLKTKLDEEGELHSRKLKNTAENMRAMVDDMIDFSTLESETIQLEFEEFSPLKLAEDSASLFTSISESKNIDLKLDINVDPAIVVEGDQFRLKQILLNILTNAFEYTNRGSVTLKVRCQELGNNCRLVFEVIDTGTGIPEEIRSQMFTTEEKGESSNDENRQHSGLEICEKLIKQMGGTIGVTSKNEQGSTFWFELSLPCVRNELSHSALKAIEKDNKAGTSSRILLVDDNHLNQLVVGRMLERLGVEVNLASDGQNAIEEAKKGGFDLILMDYDLSGTSGLEAASEIRAWEKSTDQKYIVPIVALCENREENMLQECTDAGMNELLRKPLKKKQIVSVLERYLFRSF